MLKSFIQYIKKHEIISEKTTLIGVSGGRDSVVLCELYSKANLKFAIAHVNFNLRGEDAQKDEAYVNKLSKKYQVPLHNKSCDTKAYAQQHGISIQMAARDLRMDWFKELIVQNDYGYFATAHHQDDAIETYLINQIRGTGIAGLHGILPKLGQLVHPLLFASREDIDDFVKLNKLAFREDKSNASTKYLRNKVRLDLIPLLEEINPQIKKVLSGNMTRIASAEDIYNLKIAECKKELVFERDEQVLIKIDPIKEQVFAPTLFFELIKEFGFNYSQAQQAIEVNDETKSGALYFSPSHKMLLDRDCFIIEEIKAEDDKIAFIESDDIVLESPISFKFRKTLDLTIERNIKKAQLDFQKLEFPLTIRKWKQGDYFYPLGMKGRKKLLSDFFIDQKFSLFQKEETWLLCSGEDIVWVVGYRMDDRFKITKNTQQVFEICLD